MPDDALRQRAKHRVATRADDDRGAGPADDGRPQETKVALVKRIGIRRRCLVRRLFDDARERVVLLDRHRFAGEGRLADEQILGADQADVRGNHVSGGEVHDVARHEVLEWHFTFLADHRLRGVVLDVPPRDRGGRPHHGAERFRRPR